MTFTVNSLTELNLGLARFVHEAPRSNHAAAVATDLTRSIH